ncbi:hypothetical protein BJY52DRAFT_898177 [Lactarius psammicola]|nr:hypothetical protein BJY52DRAFT_898177 [Lactarius psammicola]
MFANAVCLCDILPTYDLPTMSIEQSFQISVPEDALALLKCNLNNTRLSDEVNPAEWVYGAPLADIRRLASRWKNGRVRRTECVLCTPAEYRQGCYPTPVCHGPRLGVVSRFWPCQVVVKSSYLVRGARKLLRGDQVFPGMTWSEGVLEKGFHAEHFTEL